MRLYDALAAELETLGPVHHLVAPNKLHHLWRLFMEEMAFCHRASRTALVCDLVQRFDPDSLRGLRGLAMRLDGLVGPGGSTPREWRASWWDRCAGRRALHTALAWKPARLVIAHGMLPEGDGSEALRRGLRWLA